MAASVLSYHVKVIEESQKVPTYATGSSSKVLLYHLMSDITYGGNEYLFVRPDEFREQLKYIEKRKLEYLFADQWSLSGHSSVILTFDDGYEDNYTEMFPILKEYDAKATVFLITDLIGKDGYLNKEQIKEMADSGLVKFECHTATHQDLRGLSDQEVRGEFETSVKEIAAITGISPTVLAYPGGYYDERIISIAEEYFDIAYSTEQPGADRTHSMYNVPRFYVTRDMTRGLFSGFIDG